MNSGPTIFLVDDDASVRDAVGLFLESLGMTVKVYSSAQVFLDSYRSEWPGCMVLDISMPGMTGLELQEVLQKRSIELPIIFLTGQGNIPQSAKAFKAGAVDFIEKPFNDKQLLERIQEAIAIDSQNRQQKEKQSEILEHYSRLTSREREVMGHVVDGLSNKEIARELEISHRTIDIHRARIMEKMGAHSLADLVRMTSRGSLDK